MPEYHLNEGRSRSPEESASQKRAGNLFRLILLLAIVCLIQFGLLAMLVFGRRHDSGVHFQPPVMATTANAIPQEPYLHDHPGLWGNLEYARISLEPPDQFVPTEANFFGPTRWFFEGYTPATLAEFFNQCGLPPAQLAELTNSSAWSERADGVLVLPGDNLVLALDEPARKKIYSALARSRENTLHLWPFKSRSASLDTWFGDAGLSDETLALLKKLVYRRGEYLCFSDISLVYPRISSDDERGRLIKRLARTRTLLMKLQVNPDSNVDALADYWAKGRRNKDIAALLDTLVRSRLLDLVLRFIGQGPLFVQLELLDEFLRPHGGGKRPGGIALQPPLWLKFVLPSQQAWSLEPDCCTTNPFQCQISGRCLTVDARRGDGDVTVLQVGSQILHLGCLCASGLLAMVKQQMNFYAPGIGLEQFGEHRLQGEAVGAHPDFPGLASNSRNCFWATAPSSGMK